MSNIVIDIAAEFSGKKAFKQADTSTQKLTKNVAGLAKTFGLAFGTTAVLAYAKASVRAAAADQKAQTQLALALKNVGLERDAPSAERYIARLQSEFGILDDKLRPAYQQLAVATQSTTETQKLLGIALDISASTGKELGSVTGALSKAFLGNNTALSKLGVGISKADLKSKSFNKITEDLAKTFKGSATAAAGTFAGSMAKLGVASANVQEIIGEGIIDGLKLLSKDKSIDELATNMERAALAVGDFARGLGVVLALLDKIPGGFKLDVGMVPVLGAYASAIIEAGAKARRIAQAAASKNPIQTGTFLNPTKTNKLAKDKLKVDSDALKLAKAKAIFDLQKIQIEAALKGKISEEDRIRLLLMKAIEAENIKDIDKYTKLLDEAQKKTEALRTLVTSIKSGDAFVEFRKGLSEADAALNVLLKKLETMDKKGAAAAIGGAVIPGAGAVIPGAGGNPFVPNPILPGAGSSKDEKDAVTAIINAVVPAAVIAAAATNDAGTSVIAEIIATVVPAAAIAAAASEDAALAIAAIANNTDPTMIDWAAIYAAAETSSRDDRGRSADNITVNISAGVIASQEEFVALVQDAVQVNNRRGNNLEVAGII